MDKGAINLNREKINVVIRDFHESLKNYGLKDNHIALFGSFHNGNPHEDSDMDIVIISEEFQGKDIIERIKLASRAEREISKKHTVPMDVLLKTPEEYGYSKRTFFDAEIII